MNFNEFLNKKFNNEYTFVKLTDVIYSKSDKLCTCKFVYDGNIRDLDENDKSLFSDALREYIGVDIEILVKFKKESLDKEVLYQHISTFIQINFPSAYASFKPDHLKVSIEDNVMLYIKVYDMYFDYLQSRNFEKELIKYLSDYYFKSFTVQLSTIGSEDKLKDALVEQESIIQNIIDEVNVMSTVEFFEVEKVRKLIGPELNPECRRYNSLKNPVENIVTAGAIKNLYESTFKSKTMKDEDGAPLEKVYYRFKLVYGDEAIDCVYFPRKNDLANFQTLNEGDEIIVSGNVDKYNERVSIKVDGISLCKLKEIVEKDVEYRPVPSEYVTIVPKEYVVHEQSDLFNFDAEEQINDVLRGKTYVAYDFETTGLKYSEDEIIEIGALKIVDGKIKETFTTLLRPVEKEISEEITKLTGITPEMVENCPTMSQVIGDFYKFCYGSTMVGHNSIGFDNLFLQKVGRDNKFNFDMPQLDTYRIAREYVKSVKNHKLGTLTKYFNIKLDNAHRAMFDTMATAELFMKLSEFLAKE